MEEYTTFFVTAKDGSRVEMAVVDEFEYDRKRYVVSSVVKGDIISDEGQYIYRLRIRGDDFSAEPITSKTELREVTKAYMDMEE